MAQQKRFRNRQRWHKPLCGAARHSRLCRINDRQRQRSSALILPLAAKNIEKQRGGSNMA